MYKIFTVMFLVIFLTGCGYQIRGQLHFPAGIRAVHLVGASPELITAFEKVFRFSSARLVSQPNDSSITIKILEDRFERRTASITSRGTSTEFEVISYLKYELYNTQGQLLIGQQQLTESRVYFNDQKQIIAKQNEEKVIRQEIYIAVISRLIEQVRLGLKEVELQTDKLTQTGFSEHSTKTDSKTANDAVSTANKTELIVNEVREQVESISRSVQQLINDEANQVSDQNSNLGFETQ